MWIVPRGKQYFSFFNKNYYICSSYLFVPIYMNTLSHSCPITITRIEHRGERRIGVCFPYDQELIKKVKVIEGARWSASKRCWHVPDTLEIRQRLMDKDLLLETAKISEERDDLIQDASPTTTALSSGTTVGVPTSGALSGIASPGEALSVLPQTDTQEAADIPVIKQGTPEIVLQGQQFVINLPYQVKDVAFIKSLPGSWWHVHSKRWIVRAIPANLELLQAHFAYWNADAYARCMELILKTTDPLLVEMYHSPERPGFVAIKIKGHGADHEFLKHLWERQYDEAFKRWWIPSDQVILDRIRNHYARVGAKILDRTQL